MLIILLYCYNDYLHSKIQALSQVNISTSHLSGFVPEVGRLEKV